MTCPLLPSRSGDCVSNPVLPCRIQGSTSLLQTNYMGSNVIFCYIHRTVIYLFIISSFLVSVQIELTVVVLIISF